MNLISRLSEAHKKALVIADNRLVLNAEWDEKILATGIERLQELDFDVDLLGFSEEELEDLLAIESQEDCDGLTDPDDVSEPPSKPVSETGRGFLYMAC